MERPTRRSRRRFELHECQYGGSGSTRFEPDGMSPHRNRVAGVIPERHAAGRRNHHGERRERRIIDDIAEIECTAGCAFDVTLEVQVRRFGWLDVDDRTSRCPVAADRPLVRIDQRIAGKTRGRKSLRGDEEEA